MMKMTILQKKSSRRNVFFGTNLDFINHPLQDFWNFPPTFPQYFQIFSQISIFGEFRYLCLKFGTFSINIHGEKCFQSCTLFGSFFNFHIVHCCSDGKGQILFAEFVTWALEKNLDIEEDID